MGRHVASIEADGWTYGVADIVTWIDPTGAVHDRGWPSCLGAVGEVAHVRFGAVPIALPHNGSQRIVVRRLSRIGSHPRGSTVSIMATSRHICIRPPRFHDARSLTCEPARLSVPREAIRPNAA